MVDAFLVHLVLCACEQVVESVVSALLLNNLTDPCLVVPGLAHRQNALTRRISGLTHCLGVRVEIELLRGPVQSSQLFYSKQRHRLTWDDFVLTFFSIVESVEVAL